MVITEKDRVIENAGPVVDLVRDAEELAVESVRKFVDTVNSIVVDVRDDRLRRKIIDAGVEMTEHLVGVSSALAQKIVTAASDAWAQPKSGTEAPK